MITISIDNGFGNWDNYSFSIEEVQDKINDLEAAIDEASNVRASRLMGIIKQLQEAMAENSGTC
jgi:hypothetical protein